jgi:tetratricopeptide (TPR) repeat protein
MRHKKHILINALLFIFVFSLIPISGKSAGNEENAIKLFQSKQFNEALPIFSELIKQSPTDTILNYYTGVCLIETNRFGDEAKHLLLLASQGDVPLNVNFYIGKNYHALNFFEPALTYYNRFKETGKKSELKLLGLKEKIELCSNHINPFANLNPIPTGFVKSDSLNSPELASVYSVKITGSAGDSLKSEIEKSKESILEIPKSLNDTVINFNLTSDIYYSKISQFRTTEGEKFFIEGWKNSEDLKKLIFETDSLRAQYSKSNSENKASISTWVLELEKQTINTKSLIDFNFSKAGESELNYWNKATEIEKEQLQTENDSIKSFTVKKALIELVEGIRPDTIVPEPVSVDSLTSKPDTIPIKPVETGKIVFKVQIGAYNTELPESAKRLYKKISALRKIDQVTDERNYTIYTIGELTNIKDAVKLQEQIRLESVKDAFVIAIKNGKRIPLSEALESTK